jgi:hypothetical protein
MAFINEVLEDLRNAHSSFVYAPFLFSGTVIFHLLSLYLALFNRYQGDVFAYKNFHKEFSIISIGVICSSARDAA